MPTTVVRLGTRNLSDSIASLIRKVVRNHDLVKKAIRETDIIKSKQVYENADEIAALANEIQADLEFMVAKGPVDKDLRRVIAYLSAVKEIERIDDYALHIARFVMTNEKLSSSSIKRIDKMHRLFRKMLSGLEILIQEEDTKKAIQVASMDTEVDNMFTSIRDQLIKSISDKTNVKDVKERVFVISILTSLERAADHIVSICEMISYIKSGRRATLR